MPTDRLPEAENEKKKNCFSMKKERFTRLEWIICKSIDMSHIANIDEVMSIIARTDHTVLIAKNDIK